MTTKITLDRAQSILDAAVFAGLAQLPMTDADGYKLGPDLEAKLADLGIDKLTEMNSEQGDAVEAFVSASAT